jgi:hypothetical protein
MGALALYLFLVTVADADGLSWYSDAALCRQLSLDASLLECARSELVRCGLAAYSKPLYQILDLAPVGTGAPVNQAKNGHPRAEGGLSIGQILQGIMQPGGAR